MAGIFQQIPLKWKGQEYSIDPTMRLLNTIEQQVSLSMLAAQMQSGDVRFSHMATVVAIMLQSAGVSVTAEETLLALTQGDESEMVSMTQAIIMAAFPTPKKNDAPSSVVTQAAKKRANRKT